MRGHIWDLIAGLRPRLPECVTLALVLLSGVVYFSYGSSQLHGYGCGDLSVHHSWIYGLIEGKIFSDGVYPEAMHSFVYCLNALFGIQVYSVLLYLQCIHVVVFLFSAYCLLRETFRWRYTPILVLTMYLSLDVAGADMIYGMARLQWTLPLEFGLHTQFLCTLFLIRYLKNTESAVRRGKETKYRWNPDLFLFAMSLAASIAIHYYTTVMAFLMCVSVAVFAWRKIFGRKNFIPLCCAVLCGCLTAAAPMAGALASGIPFNYSIDWAVNSMDGEITRGFQKEIEEGQGDGGQEAQTGQEEPGRAQEGLEDPAGLSEEPEKADGQEELEGPAGLSEEPEKADGQERLEDPAVLSEEPEEVQKQEDPDGRQENELQKEDSIWKKLGGIYRYGYVRLYGFGRAACILGLTGIAIVLEAVRRRKRRKLQRENGTGYAPMILLSFLFILTYAMPYVGLPELISDSRFCSAGHMAVLAVVWMPFDTVSAGLTAACGEVFQQWVTFFTALAFYAATLLTGSYRGFLFYEMERYDAAVTVTNSIIEAFPKHSFLIISPTDELYPVIEYGWHEELLTFVRNCEKGDYSVPQEYVFLYVEKKPLLYAQAHFFEGPFWLGQEKYLETYLNEYSKKRPGLGASQSPEIIASQVSGADARKNIEDTADAWSLYTGLESRTILESKAYEWCQRFMRQHPREMNVYYEDESFVCYYIVQDVNAPYELGVK